MCAHMYAGRVTQMVRPLGVGSFKNSHCTLVSLSMHVFVPAAREGPA